MKASKYEKSIQESKKGKSDLAQGAESLEFRVTEAIRRINQANKQELTGCEVSILGS